eukprot:m.255755 g.255755  ORF g.255755 m.255755 type:complete len:132 (+) comp15948_c0_seq5:127-522(+)
MALSLVRAFANLRLAANGAGTAATVVRTRSLSACTSNCARFLSCSHTSSAALPRTRLPVAAHSVHYIRRDSPCNTVPPPPPAEICVAVHPRLSVCFSGLSSWRLERPDNSGDHSESGATWTQTTLTSLAWT